MKVPDEARGGFSGQINHAASHVKASMTAAQKKKKGNKKQAGIPTVTDNVSNRLCGQPKGRAVTGMPDEMLNRLATPGANKLRKA